jgi:hypothetical protein
MPDLPTDPVVAAFVAVDSEDSGGRALLATFTNSTWGTMHTRWRFTVTDGRITRFDTGQA